MARRCYKIHCSSEEIRQFLSYFVNDGFTKPLSPGQKENSTCVYHDGHHGEDNQKVFHADVVLGFKGKT